MLRPVSQFSNRSTPEETIVDRQRNFASIVGVIGTFGACLGVWILHQAAPPNKAIGLVFVSLSFPLLFKSGCYFAHMPHSHRQASSQSASDRISIRLVE